MLSCNRLSSLTLVTWRKASWRNDLAPKSTGRGSYFWEKVAAPVQLKNPSRSLPFLFPSVEISFGGEAAESGRHAVGTRNVALAVDGRRRRRVLRHRMHLRREPAARRVGHRHGHERSVLHRLQLLVFLAENSAQRWLDALLLGRGGCLGRRAERGRADH